MANQRFHSRIVGGRVLADDDPRPGAALADLGMACTHIEGQLPGTRLAYWSLPVSACRHTTDYDRFRLSADIRDGRLNVCERRNRSFAQQSLR
jgi:hypothetical protein